MPRLLAPSPFTADFSLEKSIIKYCVLCAKRAMTQDPARKKELSAQLTEQKKDVKKNFAQEIKKMTMVS